MTDHITSYKALLFAFALDGLVLWIAYKSFLYPELTKKVTKDPFNDLDSLANSDYMWVSIILCYMSHAFDRYLEIPNTFYVDCTQALRIGLITLHYHPHKLMKKLWKIMWI